MWLRVGWWCGAVRASVPVCPTIGRPGGCRSFLRPVDRLSISVGMMGFAVILAGEVNQGGATAPAPVRPRQETGGSGVMTCTTAHRSS